MSRSISATLSAGNSDEKYCQALGSSYREYNNAATNAEAAAAMAQCNTNSAAAIPVLEKHLKEAKVALPSRN
jgi:hypothetical protein